jgi:hypothetical protein
LVYLTITPSSFPCKTQEVIPRTPKNYSKLSPIFKLDHTHHQIPIVTTESIAKQLSSIKVSKTSGADNIPNWVLKIKGFCSYFDFTRFFVNQLVLQGGTVTTPLEKCKCYTLAKTLHTK